jgi:hypothetical protein
MWGAGGAVPAVQPARRRPSVRRAPRSAGRTAWALLATVLLIPATGMFLMLATALATGEVVPEDWPFVLLFAVPAPVLLVAAVRAWRGRVLRGALAGEVRGLQQRSERAPFGPEGEMWTVVSFRLERFDEAGNRITPVPVELRGLRFTGTLNEGDWVEVEAQEHPGEAHRVEKVFDATTGTMVAALGRSPGTKVSLAVGWLIGMGVILAIVLFVVALVVGS